MRIAIIGIGRLGSVFAKALSRGHELILIDKEYEHTKEFALSLGAKAEKDLKKAVDADIVIVAVKPANVEEVIRQVKDAQLIVSCAAGIPIKKLESWGAKKVVRVMPNICAEANEAVIAYTMHAETAKKEKVFLTAFSSLGRCFRTDEDHLDPITAVSGSGPAFVAYFADAMIQEAVAEGLDPELAEKVVAQTLVGTGKLMQSGWKTIKIIETVASPGGTTEAGLNMLEERGTSQAVRSAVKFATEKAKELGK